MWQNSDREFLTMLLTKYYFSITYVITPLELDFGMA